jgi:hypothetical protein
MSLTSTFMPSGPTVLVGASAVQANATSGSAVNYRVRCLVSAYLTWGGAGISAAGAPSAGSPVTNTIGMTAGGIETFTFPANSSFISSVAASFEVTPGEGL